MSAPPSRTPGRPPAGMLLPILFCLVSLAGAGEAAPTATDQLLQDALEGQPRAILGYGTVVPRLDEAQARMVLERVRASGNRRLSGLAVTFLGHPEPFIRQMAVSTIARLGLDGSDTLDRVVRAIADPARLVGRAAGDALATLRDARSWPRLIAALNGRDPEVARIAHDSLQRQTSQSLPAERNAWDRWYQERLAQEEKDFDRFRQDLAATDGGRQITAIDGLASLVLMRDQATSLLIPLAQHESAAVRMRAEGHLRQWTGTVGRESLGLCLDRAKVTAVAPPPAPPVSAGPASASSALAKPVAPTKAFLDTSLGLLCVVTVLAAILGSLVWFLRTPAGQAVKAATQRFARKTGAAKVVVMIEERTRRLVKPIAKPIRQISNRISSDANRALRKVDIATRRLARGARKRVTSSSDDHLALERKADDTAPLPRPPAP